MHVLPSYSVAIGPWLEHLYRLGANGPESCGLVEAAHTLSLEVHPYTLRLDSLPDGFGSFEALIHFVVGTLSADGLFTDFPDLVRQIVEPHQAPS